MQRTVGGHKVEKTLSSQEIFVVGGGGSRDFGVGGSEEDGRVDGRQKGARTENWSLVPFFKLKA